MKRLKMLLGMLALAAEAERTSIRKYTEFAQMAVTKAAKNALLMIAMEEKSHLAELEATAENL